MIGARTVFATSSSSSDSDVDESLDSACTTFDDFAFALACFFFFPAFDDLLLLEEEEELELLELDDESAIGLSAPLGDHVLAYNQTPSLSYRKIRILNVIQ